MISKMLEKYGFDALIKHADTIQCGGFKHCENKTYKSSDDCIECYEDFLRAMSEF